MNDWCSAAFRSPQPFLISANNYFLECGFEAHFLLSAAVPSSAQRKTLWLPLSRIRNTDTILYLIVRLIKVFQMTLWFPKFKKAVAIPSCLFPVPSVTLIQPEDLLSESRLLAQILHQEMALGTHLHHSHESRLWLSLLGIWLLQGSDPQLAMDFLLQHISFAAWNTFHNKQDAWGGWLSPQWVLFLNRLECSSQQKYEQQFTDCCSRIIFEAVRFSQTPNVVGYFNEIAWFKAQSDSKLVFFLCELHFCHCLSPVQRFKKLYQVLS